MHTSTSTAMQRFSGEHLKSCMTNATNQNKRVNSDNDDDAAAAVDALNLVKPRLM